MKGIAISGILTFILLLSGTIRAQEVWSLQKCIDYAYENNIQIKQQVINTNYSNNQLQSAKLKRYPTLGSQISHNYSFGLSRTQNYTYNKFNSSESDVSLQASVDLFAGFTKQNTIKQRQFELQSSLEDLNKAKNDIAMQITSAYLEILMDKELKDVAKVQLDITKNLEDKTLKLVEAGSLAQGRLLEVQAQKAKEELQLVEAENRLQLAYLNLVQILDMKLTKNFEIETPALSSIDMGASFGLSDDVYSTAVNIRPEIKSAEYKLKGYEKQFDVSKGALYPTLSFGASYFTRYNNKFYDKFDPVTQEPLSVMPFGDQLKNNAQKALGFTLNIPIFNQYQAKMQIKNAKLQVESSTLELQNQKNNLRKEIETAYTNASAALNRYFSNEKAVTSMKEAFRYNEEKFNLGAVSSYDYNESKNNLTKAESDLLQAKYEYIFRTKILDFYKGVPIKL
ncbi:MAG: TolC family protein [Bacteroidota bacterium]|nr:TolC family protein [Bacteroidota bacterium]